MCPFFQPITKRAAIGIRAHSGWAALVAVSGSLHAPEILERRRILLVDASIRGAVQPYHFAAELKLKEAEGYLGRCAATAKRLAVTALQEVSAMLAERGYEAIGCGVLLASGRPVPRLAETLASHALIHTAEGEFFRAAFRGACQELELPVSGVRERELFDHAEKELGIAASQVKSQLLSCRRAVGSPWTQDQKNAALLGWLVLAGHKWCAWR